MPRYSHWIQHCREKTETFSLPGSVLCTPASRQPLAVSQRRILKFVFASHTANRERAARRRRLDSNCRRVFLFFFLFFLQAALCAQGIDGSSHGSSGNNARKSTAIAGDAAKSLPSRSDPGKQELGPTEAFSLREHRPSAGRLVSILL